jgi:hypothetical protein
MRFHTYVVEDRRKRQQADLREQPRLERAGAVEEVDPSRRVGRAPRGSL